LAVKLGGCPGIDNVSGPVTFRDQPCRTIDLCRERYVLGVDGKRRLIAVDLRAGFDTVGLDAEREPGNVL
jgi:hypothetical protein